MRIHVGRGGASVGTLWNDPDETVAVVKSFHDPPRYIVFARPARGMQWLKDDDFDSYGGAEDHARKLAKR